MRIAFHICALGTSCLLISFVGGCMESHATAVQRRVCVQTLNAIQSAKETWMKNEHKTSDDMPTDSDLFGPAKPIIRKPMCPAGGVYTIGKVGEKTKCSVRGH